MGSITNCQLIRIDEGRSNGEDIAKRQITKALYRPRANQFSSYAQITPNDVTNGSNPITQIRRVQLTNMRDSSDDDECTIYDHLSPGSTEWKQTLQELNDAFPKRLTVLPQVTPKRSRPLLCSLSLSEWIYTREAVNTPKNDRSLYQWTLFNCYVADRAHLNESLMPAGLPSFVLDTLTNWENNPG
jgi:hypothetical protein